MPTLPAVNDRDYDLWKKIAWNLYGFAVDGGVEGLNAPSINDTQQVLQKKIAYYSAAVV
jgi:hypothetical protein